MLTKNKFLLAFLTHFMNIFQYKSCVSSRNIYSKENISIFKQNNVMSYFNLYFLNPVFINVASYNFVASPYGLEVRSFVPIVLYKGFKSETFFSSITLLGYAKTPFVCSGL